MNLSGPGPIENLLAARAPALLKTAFLLTGDRESARDLLQAALERVSRRLNSVREPKALEAYLRATMATTAANQRRRMWRGERPVAVLPESASPDATAASDLRLSVLTALRALPPGQRAVVVLRFYEDYSEEQIATTLKISRGTVKSRLSRALAELRSSELVSPTWRLKE